MATIKNVSRVDYHVNLEVLERKSVDLKPDGILNISDDELDTLISFYPKTFENGFLTVLGKKEKLDVIKVENIMSDADIDKMLELSPAKFKTALNKITSLNTIKDIRLKTAEEGKGDKYLVVIDELISKLSDDLAM